MKTLDILQVKAELRQATSAVEIDNILGYYGFKFSNKAHRKLIKHYISKTPELNVKHAEGRALTKKGRKLIAEARSAADGLINPEDILQEAQELPSICTGDFELANGKRHTTVLYPLYRQGMKAIASKLRRSRASMTDAGLFPVEDDVHYVYVASFQCNDISFCKIGRTDDLQKRMHDLRGAYDYELELTNTFRLDYETAKEMESMLLAKFVTARKTAQVQASGILRSGVTGYTEVLFGRHLEEVKAKAEALYLFLS